MQCQWVDSFTVHQNLAAHLLQAQREEAWKAQAAAAAEQRGPGDP